MKPWIGAVVHVYPTGHVGVTRPYAGIVADVINDDLINVTYLTHVGEPKALPACCLHHGLDIPIRDKPFAVWMPSQHERAAMEDAIAALESRVAQLESISALVVALERAAP